MQLFNNMSMDSKVELFKQRYNKLTSEIEELQFYRQCCVEKFLQEARGYYSMEVPYSKDFYITLMDGSNADSKQKRRLLQNTLRIMLSKDIDVTGYAWEGFDRHGTCVYFTSQQHCYELIIPFTSSFSMSNIANDDFSIVNWEAPQFRLLSQAGEHTWETIWTGYKLAECTYFKENDSSEVPFT